MKTRFPTREVLPDGFPNGPSIASLNNALEDARAALSDADSTIKQVQLLLSGVQLVQHPVAV